MEQNEVKAEVVNDGFITLERNESIPYDPEQTTDNINEKKEDCIYTHDEAMLILNEFEEVLSEYDIKVPSPEDDDREEDNDAALYGSTYSDLLDFVENALIYMLDRHSNGAKIVTGKFSGSV